MPGKSQHSNETPQPHIVIVGAGFAGLTCAMALKEAPAKVTVIDRHNYHLFQPLLYQVASAALAPADIAQPIRTILRGQTNAFVMLGEVERVALDQKCIFVKGAAVPYDYLVLAPGAVDNYFGHGEWAKYAPGMKEVEDATLIRSRLLMSFEAAELENNPAERAAELTFVIVGGGPTGVEMAGAIAELARHSLVDDFRAINPAEARVILVEAGPRLLPAFPESLSAEAKRSLEQLGVEVALGKAVTTCDQGGVTRRGERIAASTVVWAAGVAASPAARWLGAEKDRLGRVVVGADLSVPGSPEIFVTGDTAHVPLPGGGTVPGLAPAAKQMGAYAARVIRARLAGKAPPPPFKYRHLGSLATIGRAAAVADFGKFRLKGRLAWLLWGIIHVGFLNTYRSRILVAIQWVWAYITYGRGARLITTPGTGPE